MARLFRAAGSARLRLARSALVLLPLLCAVAGACGKRGAPSPPLPRGPHPPGGVLGRQIGHRAVVGFEVPRPRGPRPTQAPVRAELVRVTYQPGLTAPSDPDALRRRGDVVAQVVSDPLPVGGRLLLEDLRLGELAGNGTGWTLRYAVRVKDRRGRSSPLVMAPDLELLPSVPGPRDLVAEPTAAGVRLVWQPPEPGGTHTYNIYRSTPEAPWPELPLNSEPLAATEYLDSGIETGAAYIYAVRVSLASSLPYREGEPSSTREVRAEDHFAPRAPQSLVAVQEGPAIRLFWDPNPERDVAGYRVERRVAGGAWQPIGPTRVETPSYRDEGVQVGVRFAYRVSAVDRAVPANTSEPSSVVELEVLAEPVAPGPPGT